MQFHSIPNLKEIVSTIKIHSIWKETKINSGVFSTLVQISVAKTFKLGIALLVKFYTSCKDSSLKIQYVHEYIFLFTRIAKSGVNGCNFGTEMQASLDFSWIKKLNEKLKFAFLMRAMKQIELFKND